MKKVGLLFACAAVLYTPFISAEQTSQTAVVIVQEKDGPVISEAPPEPIIEVKTVSPSHNHVWIGGHWRWDGRWFWEKGHWATRPSPNVYWKEGHWSRHHHHRGWYWVPGHWKKK